MHTVTVAESFFSELVRERTSYLRELKKRAGKKIFGYFCSYTPEELLIAAGIHPVRLFGGTQDITQADTLLQTFVCPFVRGVLDTALKGGFDYLDGIVHAYTCDATCGLFGIWQNNIKTDFSYTFSPPYFMSDSSLAYMVRELARLKEALEEFCGKQISQDSLVAAIASTNRKRSVLKRLYAIRACNPSPIAGSRALDVVNAACLMPAEEFSDAAEALITRILSPMACGQDPRRVFISGSELHDPEILQIIEEAGAAVVGDDLCTGSRSFFDLVDVGNDPLEAIARRYIDRIPCPSRLPVRRRLQFIREGMKESRAEAVIFIIQKFCDPHLAEQPLLSEWMKAEGIPNLVIETEQRVGPSREQVRTRVQGFFEMIGGRSF